MMNIMLVCLTSGNKKNGKGMWYKATLKAHNSEGKPVSKEFFISTEAGEQMVKDGLFEDTPISVSLGFDDYFNPIITGISRASNNKAVKE